jgi:FMN-dependent NADH-azoreductase
MKTLLQINSSLFSEGGNSSQLSQQFVKRWQAQNPGGRVIVRDPAAVPGRDPCRRVFHAGRCPHARAEGDHRRVRRADRRAEIGGCAGARPADV